MSMLKTYVQRTVNFAPTYSVIVTASFVVTCSCATEKNLHLSVLCVCSGILQAGMHQEVIPVFPQVHGGGGGYDSDFSGDDDEQGETSEKSLKR